MASTVRFLGCHDRDWVCVPCYDGVPCSLGLGPAGAGGVRVRGPDALPRILTLIKFVHTAWPFRERESVAEDGWERSAAVRACWPY